VGTTIRGTAADGHELSIYRADPLGAPRGALVIAQEIFGVNSHIRAVCDDYAAQGYVVVAPALFDRAERGVELGYQPDDVTRGRAIREKVSLDQALADVEAAAREVAGAGRIGVVGYCWGGTVAWVAATRSRTFRAAVSYYGGGVPDLAGEQPNCPGPAPLRRAGPRDPARRGGEAEGGAPGAAGLHLPGRAWLQLRPARLVPRRERAHRARTRARLPARARRLILEAERRG
jgi:dienelactone hydrolase